MEHTLNKDLFIILSNLMCSFWKKNDPNFILIHLIHTFPSCCWAMVEGRWREGVVWVVCTCHVSLLFTVSPRYFVRFTHCIVFRFSSTQLSNLTCLVVNPPPCPCQGLFWSSICLPSPSAELGRVGVCCREWWQLQHLVKSSVSFASLDCKIIFA